MIPSPNDDVRPVHLIRRSQRLSLSGAALTQILQIVLAKGLSFKFRAKGFSMSPFIKDGDVITISPLSKASLSCGDVLAFTHSVTKKLIVHRVVSMNGAYLQTKGDNSVAGGEFFLASNILGFVTKVQRNGREVFFGLGHERRLIGFLSKKNLLLPMLSFLWRFIRPLKKGRIP